MEASIYRMRLRDLLPRRTARSAGSGTFWQPLFAGPVGCAGACAVVLGVVFEPKSAYFVSPPHATRSWQPAR